MEFFKDFLEVTLIQHLFKYWYIWSIFVLVSFVTLFCINKGGRNHDTKRNK